MAKTQTQVDPRHFPLVGTGSKRFHFCSIIFLIRRETPMTVPCDSGPVPGWNQTWHHRDLQEIPLPFYYLPFRERGSSMWFWPHGDPDLISCPVFTYLWLCLVSPSCPPRQYPQFNLVFPPATTNSNSKDNCWHWTQPGPSGLISHDIRKWQPSRHIPSWHHQVPLPFHFLLFWEGDSHRHLHVILDVWHCLAFSSCM